MLKKCIKEIERRREKTSNLTENEGIKIAAPKPVRATRTIALTHLASSKWLQTSPIKNDNIVEEKSDLIKEVVDDKSFDNTRQVEICEKERNNF